MRYRLHYAFDYLLAWFMALLAIAVVVLVTRHIAAAESAETERATRTELSNLSRLSAEHASRTLHAADQALQLVRLLYLRDGNALDLPALVRQGAIDAELFHQVGIIDAQGIYRLSNLPDLAPIDLSDREHFQVHAKRTTDELFVSKPVLGRASKRWSIQLTRRITQPNGGFAGVAVVSVDAQYFDDFYAGLDLGETGSAALVGVDGVVRSRYSKLSDGMGRSLKNSPALAMLAGGQADGFYESASLLDQVVRLHQYRALHGFPLYVTVSRGTQEYRADGLAKARVDWLLAVLASGLLLALAALYTWYRWREQRSYRALAEQHAQTNLALDGGGLGLWQWDLTRGRFTLDNRLLATLGFAPGEVPVDNTVFLDHLHPDDLAALRRLLPPVLKGEVPQLLLEHRLRHKDGHWLSLMARGKVVARDRAGRALRLVGTDVDRTGQKQAEEAQRIAAVAFASSSAMLVSDAKQRILRVNPAFEAMSGYTAAELLGQPAGMLKSGHHDSQFYATMWASIQHSGHWEGEVWNRRKSGEVFPDWLAISVVTDAQGQVSDYVSIHRDITLKKRSEDKIRHMAFFDPLTDLPNRRLLLDRIGQLAAAFARNRQVSAVLFVDLDRFKLLNDTHGHDQGDELLQQVARRLLACVREVDTVARLGGDEFVVALAQLGEDVAAAEAGALGVAQKILMSLAEPYALSHVTWDLSACVGLAMLTQASELPEDLLKRADTAMYAAKQAGRNAVRIADNGPVAIE